MPRRSRRPPLTGRELSAYSAGRRLGLELPDWDLVEPHLPDELARRLTGPERVVKAQLHPAAWWWAFFEGWDSTRGED